MGHGFNTLDKLIAASEQDLMKVKGLGASKSSALVKGLVKNKEVISALFQSGISIIEPQKIVTLSQKFVGKSFCITGSTTVKRDDLISIIRQHGGEFKSSVTKGVTYLILADPDKVSKKTENARKLGISILSEANFFTMI